MLNLVDQIKKNLSNECFKEGERKLTKENCTVSLTGAPMPAITIDMDNKKAPVRQTETRCDYIFIGGSSDVLLVPLELMDGKPDTTKIVNQLQAGANIADTRIIPQYAQVQFRPVAFCGGKFHSVEIRRLSRRKIRFRGKPYNIKLSRCGSRLISSLPKGR